VVSQFEACAAGNDAAADGVALDLLVVVFAGAKMPVRLRALIITTYAL
jgi:hypothetical protein